MPTFGSLFAGIGGIDLGLERAGWTGRWQVEYEPFCQRVLAKHWPDVTRYGDIHDVDWSGVEPVDLVAGGFPCQPVSVAGRRGGQTDERWLWPEFHRAIRELRPEFVLVENVTHLLALERGALLGGILGDLAALGYDAEWDCIPAAALGAPHIRDRFWLVAYSDGAGRQGHARDERIKSSRSTSERSPDDRTQVLAYSRSQRPQESGGSELWSDPPTFRAGSSDKPIDGDWWTTEPDVGRVAHGVPARVDRLRALGNAVVPQVVEFIGRRILEAESLT